MLFIRIEIVAVYRLTVEETKLRSAIQDASLLSDDNTGTHLVLCHLWNHCPLLSLVADFSVATKLLPTAN